MTAPKVDAGETPMPELVDPTGMKWRWVPAGYLREDQAATLTPEQVAEDFLAVAVTS